MTTASMLQDYFDEHGIHGIWGQYHNLRATLARHGIEVAFDGMEISA